MTYGQNFTGGGPKRRIKTIHKNLAESIHFGLELARTKVVPNQRQFSRRRLTDPEAIRETRALGTRIFVQTGKIEPQAVDSSTWLLHHDSMLDRRIFFGCFSKGRMVATGCLIYAPGMPAQDTRMPTDQLPQQYAQEFLAIPDGQLAEVASVVKLPGTPSIAVLNLFHEFMVYAHAAQIRNLSCGLEPRALRKYQDYFGGIVYELSPGNTVCFPCIKTEQSPLLFRIGANIAEARNLATRHKAGSATQRLSRSACVEYLTALHRRQRN